METVRCRKLILGRDIGSVMLLECGIRDISRVLVLTCNSVYSARSVEDAIPHVYKMEGHRSFRENPLILSGRLYFVIFSVKNVI